MLLLMLSLQSIPLLLLPSMATPGDDCAGDFIRGGGGFTAMAAA